MSWNQGRVSNPSLTKPQDFPAAEDSQSDRYSNVLRQQSQPQMKSPPRNHFHLRPIVDDRDVNFWLLPAQKFTQGILTHTWLP